MKSTRLLFVFVLAWLAVTYIALFGGTLLPGNAEAKRSFLEAVKPFRIPAINIDRSSIPRPLVDTSMTCYPSALEHAPALPAPPIGNRGIRRDPF